MKRFFLKEEMGEEKETGSVERVAAVILGVLDVHVVVHVAVLFDGETEAVRGRVVLVAMQLREQQVDAGIDQRQVGRVTEALERGPVPPSSQQRHHGGQCRNLAQLDTDVKAQDAPEHCRRVIAHTDGKPASASVQR